MTVERNKLTMNGRELTMKQRENLQILPHVEYKMTAVLLIVNLIMKLDDPSAIFKPGPS